MTKQRSIDQHRRFFAVVAAAFNHWPEAHSFQPDCAEHLRAWLLVKAKHRTIQTFHMSDDASEAARLIPIVIAVMLRKHCWAKAVGTDLHVCVPMSIAIHGPEAIGQNQFTAINADVDEIIRAETGLDPDQILKEQERAA